MKRLEAARRDGSWDRIDKVLSLAYLLHSKAYMLYDEADELLRSHGLLIGRTKQLSNRLRKGYDDYFADFKQMIPDADRRDNYFADLDDFSRTVHRWAGIPEDWQPGAAEANDNAHDDDDNCNNDDDRTGNGHPSPTDA